MTLPKRVLGHSDLEVTSVTFGAMMFGNVRAAIDAIVEPGQNVNPANAG